MRIELCESKSEWPNDMQVYIHNLRSIAASLNCAWHATQATVCFRRPMRVPEMAKTNRLKNSLFSFHFLFPIVPFGLSCFIRFACGIVFPQQQEDNKIINRVCFRHCNLFSKYSVVSPSMEIIWDENGNCPAALQKQSYTMKINR